MTDVSTFLMFEGRAEEAMRFYLSLFPGSKIERLVRYVDDDAGEANTVKHAVFAFGGQRFMCTDSVVKHGFGFTPAMSLHVACSTQPEIDGLFEKLADGGQVLMPLGEYPFSQRFGWLSDRFGVSWQLTLEAAQLTPS